MRWWSAGVLAAVVMGCGGGDEEACDQANRVADQIREAAMQDGIMAPCAEGSTDGLPPSRIAEYKEACARYEELSAKCKG